jgi:hypothetical protein
MKNEKSQWKTENDIFYSKLADKSILENESSARSVIISNNKCGSYRNFISNEGSSSLSEFNIESSSLLSDIYSQSSPLYLNLLKSDYVKSINHDTNLYPDQRCVDSYTYDVYLNSLFAHFRYYSMFFTFPILADVEYARTRFIYLLFCFLSPFFFFFIRFDNTGFFDNYYKMRDFEVLKDHYLNSLGNENNELNEMFDEFNDGDDGKKSRKAKLFDSKFTILSSLESSFSSPAIITSLFMINFELINPFSSLNNVINNVYGSALMFYLF